MMTRFSVAGLSVALLAGSRLVGAHMSMEYPAPLRSKSNPNVDDGKIDYSMTSPLAADGSNYPCKGYHSDLGTDAGKPTADFAAGGHYNLTVAGGANHNGGSCQISLSYDKGATFRVIKSFVGACPASSTSNLDFTVPSDASAGEALLAWTWNNKVGNRELYMNCAVVTITPASSKRDVIQPRAAFTALPAVFKANIGNGCTAAEGSDLLYPDPGPDVVTSPNATPQAPEGDCGSSGGSAPAPAAAPGPVASAVPTSQAQATSTGTLSKPGLPTVLPSTASSSLPSALVPDIPAATDPSPASLLPSTAAAPATPATPATTLSTSVLLQPTVSTAAPPAFPIGTGAPAAPPAPAPATGISPVADAQHASGMPCTNEGAWNCVDGRSFQRCASGTWSVVMRMAAGTSCEIGEGETLNMGPRLGGARRSVRVRARR